MMDDSFMKTDYVSAGERTGTSVRRGFVLSVIAMAVSCAAAVVLFSFAVLGACRGGY